MGTPMSLISTHSRIYSALLSSRYSWTELYDQDVSLVEEMDFYRILMSDAGFGGAIRTFYSEIAASGVQVHPGNTDVKSSKKSRIVAGIAKKSPLLRLIIALSKGFIMGRAYAYPKGRGVFASHDKTEPQNWWTFTDFADIDKQRVMLRPTKIEVPDPRNPGQKTYKIVVHRYLSDLVNGAQYFPMSKEYAATLIEFVFGDDEDRLGMGRGLAEALYLLMRAKAIIWRAKMQGLSRWGQPLLVGTIDPDRPASTGKSNLALAQDLLVKLQNMREGAAIVVPEGLADVKSLETSGSGEDATQVALDYIDALAEKLLFGAARPSQKAGGGAEAGRRVDADVTRRVIKTCRSLIEECLNRTLMRTICRLNREQFLEVDCLDGEDPVFKIIDNQETDPEAVGDRIEKAQKLKMKVPKIWAHEVMQIPVPSDDEEVLEEMQVAGMTGLGTQDQSQLNEGKAEPGGNGTPFQKTGDRAGEPGGDAFPAAK